MGRRWGSGRGETAVDESTKETADRVAKYQTDYVVGRTAYPTRTTNCCGYFEMVLLCFGFPVLPFRSWSYSVCFMLLYCLVLSVTSPGGA